MEQTVSSGNRVRQSTYELRRFKKLRKSVVNVVMSKGVQNPDELVLTEMSDVISTSYTHLSQFSLL